MYVSMTYQQITFSGNVWSGMVVLNFVFLDYLPCSGGEVLYLHTTTTFFITLFASVQEDPLIRGYHNSRFIFYDQNPLIRFSKSPNSRIFRTFLF